MEYVITMDRFGRLVLPGTVRKALQISAPAAFKAEVMGNKVELTVLPPERSRIIKKRQGIMVVSTGAGKFNAADAIAAVRDERP